MRNATFEETEMFLRNELVHNVDENFVAECSLNLEEKFDVSDNQLNEMLQFSNNEDVDNEIDTIFNFAFDTKIY